ncbi:MAG: acyltransferase [Tannerellaceae bacterium]|jgi:fucose 4-O-acetylase-like acetyltransferase|nr:acyltransferase [Tannerellaceae bacterium]
MRPLDNTIPNPDSLQSQVIDLLRFPLIVGVVFIHIKLSTVSGTGVYEAFRRLFSDILAGVSVPLFFIISGYLYFRNVDFSKQVYTKKLKRRIKTLLVPYLFWNIAALLLHFVIHSIPSLKALTHRTVDFSLVQVFWGGLVDDPNGRLPISTQFWFIRDLMVVVILSPLVYMYAKKLGLYGLLMLCVLWLMGWWYRLPGLGIVAVFFFTLGAWVSISKLNWVNEVEKVKYPVFILYPLLVTAEFLTKGWDANTYIQDIGVLCGILFWLNLGVSAIRAREIRPHKFLATASFFVFAIHDPWLLDPMSKLVCMWLNPSTDGALTVWYFAIVITVVLIGLCTYYLLRKFTPTFANFITGGR